MTSLMIWRYVPPGPNGPQSGQVKHVLTLDLQQPKSVDEIKDEIERELKVNVADQRLLWNGRELRDDDLCTDAECPTASSAMLQSSHAVQTRRMQAKASSALLKIELVERRRIRLRVDEAHALSIPAWENERVRELKQRIAEQRKPFDARPVQVRLRLHAAELQDDQLIGALDPDAVIELALRARLALTFPDRATQVKLVNLARSLQSIERAYPAYNIAYDQLPRGSTPTRQLLDLPHVSAIPFVLTVPQSPHGARFRIAVFELTGRRFDVDVEASMTGRELKRRIALQSLADPRAMRLIHQRTVLEDATTLQQARILPQARLHLLLKLPLPLRITAGSHVASTVMYPGESVQDAVRAHCSAQSTPCEAPCVRVKRLKSARVPRRCRLNAVMPPNVQFDVQRTTVQLKDTYESIQKRVA